MPTPVVSTVDRVSPAGTVGAMSPSTRERVCATGTVALLLLGAGFWLLGRPAAGSDGATHMLAPAMLMLAGLVAAGGALLRVQCGRSEGPSSELTLAVVAPLALVTASAFPSPVALAIAAVAWPLSV